MSKKIFKYIMLVSSLITVLGLAFVVGILYHYFQGQLMGEPEERSRVYFQRCGKYRDRLSEEAE